MPSDSPTLHARPWLHGLYLLALVLLLQPLIETVAATWPVRPSLVGWRFAFIGIFYTMLPTVLVGLLIAAGAAYLLRHRGVLQVVAVLAVLLGGVIVLLTVSFGLDALQMRKLVRPEAKGGFDMASIKALLTAGIATIACIALAFGGFRTGRKPLVTEHRRRQPGDGLVVGQG
jgi:uncharacterized membrane protein YraQ (UPF0718 family)